MEVCAQCGNTVRDGDKYCLYCGKSLSHAGKRLSFKTAFQDDQHNVHVAMLDDDGRQYMQDAYGHDNSFSTRYEMAKTPQFIWKGADGAQHTADVNLNEISIGRAPSCDIVLADDQMVSRRHAIVRRQGSNIVIIDIGSSNGTQVNGVDITESTSLNDGDKITIGDQEILFKYNTDDGADQPNPFPSSFVPPSQQQPPPPPVSSFTEQDTGNIGAYASQNYAPFNYNGGSQPQASYEQPQEPVYESPVYAGVNNHYTTTTSEPTTPHNAQQLLQETRALLDKLSSEVALANEGSQRIVTSVQSALNQLGSSMLSIDTASHRAELADISQLADKVAQAPLVDHVANFSKKSAEIRDIVSAHQKLLAAVEELQRQLNVIVQQYQ